LLAETWTNWQPERKARKVYRIPGVPAGNHPFPIVHGPELCHRRRRAKQIVVDAEWAQYLRIKSPVQTNRGGTPANVWKRQPVIAPAITIILNDKARSVHDHYTQSTS
jgi:hypothetical protein